MGRLKLETTLIIEKMLLAGRLPREIEAALNVKVPTVIARRLGLPLFKRGRPISTPTLTEPVLILKRQGLSNRKIAKILQVSHQRISQVFYPEKNRARAFTRWNIKINKVIKPIKCSSCATECQPEAHHINYSDPMDIEWLCKNCHSARHYPRD